jgi:hypothetical protein
MAIPQHYATTTASPRRGLEWMTRLGYAAKGLLYATVGVLALRAAFGGGGRTTDAQGAIRELGSQPFGQVLLALIALGLVGYTVWRVIEAVNDPEGRGTDAEGVIKRIGLLGSALLHGALAVFTVRLLLGDGGGGGSAQSRTAELMSKPWGQWLVGLAGLIVIGVGLYQFARAIKGSFTRHWRGGEMSIAERTWARRAGYAGLTARGVVFSIIGWFLIRAALEAQPGEARGLAGALAELASQPYGPWLLGLVAFGLVCYGAYCFVQARYRHIPA